jgi:hypothetical protein
MNEGRTIPLRWIFPITELVVCAVLLWPWRGFFIVQMRAAAHAYWPTKVEQPVLRLNVVQLPETPRERRAETMSMIRISTPGLLNIPCSLLGLARSNLVPKGMLPSFWRSISWPFIGIIFWWIAGRGVEALLASRWHVLSPSITWVEVVVSSLVILLGLFLWAGFLSDASFRSDFIYPWPLGAAASGMWILLGGATAAARLVQWRIRRQLRAPPGTARV